LITDHHVFPAQPPATGTLTGGVEEAVNATITLATPTTTTPLPGAGYKVGFLPLILFLLLLAAASLLILARRGEEPPKAPPNPLTGGPGAAPSYNYPRLRARLRRAFLEVRGAAESIVGSSLRHLAPGELARLLGGPAGDFAASYSRAMYGRGEPSSGEVEAVESEARRVVEWASRGRRG